jgi:hypothetical protein
MVSPTPTTASPSPTSTAAELAAVTAVVRRYFALVNGPTTEAAANELFAMMTPQCKCRRVATSMKQVARDGDHYFGGSQITSLVPSLDGADAAEALVDYDYRSGGIKDAGGHVLRTSRGHRDVKVVFRLVKQGSSWLIFRIEVISDGSVL